MKDFKTSDKIILKGELELEFYIRAIYTFTLNVDNYFMRKKSLNVWTVNYNWLFYR